MEKLDPRRDGSSLDLVAENVERLRELFPEVFAEGKIDFDALRETLGDYVEDREERYSFTWHGKSRARRIAQTPSAGTLLPCPEESVNWDTTQNLFIEGDNLEVLKLLQKSYHRKVKMIYIDPPYNTGKEFIYPDKYQDNLATYLRYTGQVDGEGFKLSANAETGGRFHTNWLNMMYPRLRLARNLLCDSGLIFISIDDHEFASLKLVCDEIFGEENFRGKVSRATGTPSGQGHDILVNEADYVLVYSRSQAARLRGVPLSAEEQRIYNQEDDRGRYLTRPLRKTGGEDRREDRPTMYFPLEDPDGNNVFPIGPGGYQSRWRCGPEKYESLKARGRIEWRRESDDAGGQWKPYLKFYLAGRLKQQSNLWSDLEGNKKASIDLRKLFGAKVFDFPKPLQFLERCLQISTEGADLVMDFFAGSSAFAHAAWELNASCGRVLRCISVQLPVPVDAGSGAHSAGFKTIADIGKERLRRASLKIGEDNPLYKGDLGFRVFKLSSSNVRSWDPDVDALRESLLDTAENIRPDRTEHDVLFELLLKYGLDLAVPIESRIVAGKKVAIIGAGALVVCLARDVTLETVESIAALKEELAPEVMRVVFRDAGFADDVVKTNTMQILKQAGIEDVKSL